MVKHIYSIEALAATGAALAALLFTLAFSSPAFASGNDPICQVAVTTTVKGETARTAACTWPQNTVLLMQCDVDVYGSASSPRVGNTFPDAGTLDFRYSFVSNSDPVPIFLNASQQHFTVLSVSATGTCKFGAFSRRY